ncbi:MAG: glycosyltransferase family 2 protein [Candidatus Omnitrophica bacterium]|nr:glycosyltransferase family 2 protein [Candidatus Omnitrophota bacterium]MDD5236573.1 glycosyltransferase family 2 protein [Candidatus Omnitrophota bacterium]MDD5610353.1 glycosyltransferase family 2 protein [Candidatus Omnitrophota bacterium]
MKTCIIIPTYNESKAIGEIIKGLAGYNLSILVVDDGSRDDTAKIAQAGGATVITNQKNEGKGASLIKGFDYALKNGFDAVITMDGDGQHSPLDVRSFLDTAEREGAQILLGNRMHKAKDMPAMRWLTNIFMSWLISRVCKQNISDTQCGFRLIRREALERMHLESAKYEIESEMLIEAARNGYKIAPVNIQSIYRGEKSQINPFTDTLRFIRFIFKQAWTTKH